MKDTHATVIVNLTENEDNIFKGIGKDARWGINKAKKEGLIVKETDEDKDWEEFYDIYRDEMQEKDLGYFSIDDLMDMTRKLFIVIYNDKIIGGAGIGFKGLYDIDIPRLLFNSSLKDYLNKEPNNLLYWNIILWCKRNSYRRLDLGGWQINAREDLIGVNKFKERFGKVVYFKKDYPFWKAIGRKLTRRFDLFYRINKFMKT